MNKLIIALTALVCIALATSDEEFLLSEFTKILDGTKRCVCNKMYKPVCDSNGKKYSNPCFAKCAGVTQFSPCAQTRKPVEALAETSCICTREYAPVCDKNGKRFSNACNAKCAGVTEYKPCFKKLTLAKPVPANKPCICPAVYKPVCGKNGITYGNSCRAACNKVQVASEGKCQKKTEQKKSDVEADACMCPKIYAPVCGKNGNTYGNSCSAKCAGIEVAHTGRCGEKKPVVSCMCPAIYAPVCANGKQYSNACAAKCDNATTYTNGPCNKLF